ncbi:MAG: hypothetical protein AAFR61_15680 [Bacteroidota bacterium]
MQASKMDMLQRLAAGFGPLVNKIVFMGSATLDLYVTDQAAPSNRPTEEIDCLATMPIGEFWDSLPQLEAAGFERTPQEDSPFPKWNLQGIKVNLFPLQTEALGYYNKWYEEGLFHAQPYTLSDGQEIRIFHPVYYLAAKVEAFIQRGNMDFRNSVDFEDIMFMMDYRQELVKDIQAAFHEVRGYIRDHFRTFLKHPDLEEGIYWHMPFSAGEGAVEKIFQTMRQIAEYEMAS